jgi:tRNA(Ile)-lysidine synthase
MTRRFFAAGGLLPCRVLVALSGGTDSTALLLAMSDLREDGFAVDAAHINHHLRGADSDADEAFARELCARVGIEVHVADGTLDPERIRARGIEAAAREIRYARLTEIRKNIQADFVATAHQKNDQAETVLMRLVSGGGIAALRGILPHREDGFVRPLLGLTRDELEHFVSDRGVTARHDRSNDDPRFLRNRMRSVLRELNAVDALAAVAAQAQQQWPILERAIDDAERTHADVREKETIFRSWPDDAWLRQALLHRHIHRLDTAARDVSARDLSRLAAQLDAIRRVSVTKSLELMRRGETLVLRGPLEAIDAFEVDLTAERSAFLPLLDLTVHIAPGDANPRQQTIQLPRGSEPRFLVRNRKPGDRFQPLGLTSPKKLKDFLIDRKIAAETRDTIPLLVWNGEIVWVAGVEVSERFKVASSDGDRYTVWLEGSGATDDD